VSFVDWLYQHNVGESLGTQHWPRATYYNQGTANFRNIEYIRYTSYNGQLSTQYSYDSRKSVYREHWTQYSSYFICTQFSSAKLCWVLIHPSTGKVLSYLYHLVLKCEYVCLKHRWHSYTIFRPAILKVKKGTLKMVLVKFNKFWI